MAQVSKPQKPKETRRETSIAKILENPHQFNGDRVAFDAKVKVNLQEVGMGGVTLSLANPEQRFGEREFPLLAINNFTQRPLPEMGRTETLKIECRLLVLPRGGTAPEIKFQDCRVLARK